MAKQELLQKIQELENMIDNSKTPDDAWNNYIMKSIYEIEKEMEELE